MTGSYMSFVGVTTGQSSMREVFPRWAQVLGLPTSTLVGHDLPLDTPATRYRELITEIKADGANLGGLVTTHKMGVFESASDLFDELDEHAQRFGEISCISKRDAALIGHAKDPITARLAIEEFMPPDYFEAGGGSALCLGAGGAGSAISFYLGERADRPAVIVCTDTSQERLDHAAAVHQTGSAPHAFRYELVSGPSDALVGSAPQASFVVNGTGMGKDRPGSPLSDQARFPKGGVVWDLNYRGRLEFLAQARRQADERDLAVVDGWRYFIHGWTQVIAEVFHIPMPPETVEQLAAEAAVSRR